MIIKVRVIPNSKVELVQKTGTASYKLKVREKAIEGRANIAAINMIADYFKVKKTLVTIIKGASSREKTINISV